jgi:uncharacterized protein (TIGR02996 family)
MSELDKLHAQVLQNPTADEPRIAYADAVAKTDADRAELIRVQLEHTQSRRAASTVRARHSHTPRIACSDGTRSRASFRET